ncbi:MAG: hypothetical protein M3Z56_11360 [Bacteroidota bacterium]|nr:hypothetical protein [Bacteroidota bacterium]
MKAASINELKKELEEKTNTDLITYCLRLSRFKKENKELLTFLLFEASDISAYIENVNNETRALFNEINTGHIYYIKKGIRKILRNVNKHIRFSGSKQVEAELLIQFCNGFIAFPASTLRNKQLAKMYEIQLEKIAKALSTLHPDLQYDLNKQLNKK